MEQYLLAKQLAKPKEKIPIIVSRVCVWLLFGGLIVVVFYYFLLGGGGEDVEEGCEGKWWWLLFAFFASVFSFKSPHPSILPHANC